MHTVGPWSAPSRESTVGGSTGKPRPTFWGPSWTRYTTLQRAGDTQCATKLYRLSKRASAFAARARAHGALSLSTQPGAQHTTGGPMEVSEEGTTTGRVDSELGSTIDPAPSGCTLVRMPRWKEIPSSVGGSGSVQAAISKGLASLFTKMARPLSTTTGMGPLSLIQWTALASRIFGRRCGGIPDRGVSRKRQTFAPAARGSSALRSFL